MWEREREIQAHQSGMWSSPPPPSSITGPKVFFIILLYYYGSSLYTKIRSVLCGDLYLASCLPWSVSRCVGARCSKCPRVTRVFMTLTRSHRTLGVFVACETRAGPSSMCARWQPRNTPTGGTLAANYRPRWFININENLDVDVKFVRMWINNDICVYCVGVNLFAQIISELLINYFLCCATKCFLGYCDERHRTARDKSDSRVWLW